MTAQQAVPTAVGWEDIAVPSSGTQMQDREHLYGGFGLCFRIVTLSFYTTVFHRIGDGD